MNGQPYMLGTNGEHVHFLNPASSPLLIDTIAHNLARLARYTGCTRGRPYSVAQHSVLASRIVSPGYELEALLHDASEAYLNDISSPLKSLLPDYRTIERGFDAAIRRRYALPAQESDEVHHADLVMLATEYRDLMPEDSEEWDIIRDIAPLDQRVRPWPYWWAEFQFRRRFNALWPFSNWGSFHLAGA